VEILGLGSGSFTFLSDVYRSTSWLDHCVGTHAARQAIVCVVVKYDTGWSDHFPLVIKCNMKLVSRKVSHTTVNVNSDEVWGDKNEEQILVYNDECHKRLKLLDFPSEYTNCADHYCSDLAHRIVLDNLYDDIVNALREASRVGQGGAKKSGGGSRMAGWNKYVGEAHREARRKFQDWVSCGKSKSGFLYIEMCNSRRVFKSRLKWWQNHQERLKMDALAVRHSKGDFRGFWKGTRKVNALPGLPVSVGGLAVGPRAMTDSVLNICETLGHISPGP
jgi:hypothetical protein